MKKPTIDEFPAKSPRMTRKQGAWLFVAMIAAGAAAAVLVARWSSRVETAEIAPAPIVAAGPLQPIDRLQGDWLYVRDSEKYKTEKVELHIEGNDGRWSAFKVDREAPDKPSEVFTFTLAKLEEQADGRLSAELHKGEGVSVGPKTMKIALYPDGDQLQIAFGTLFQSAEKIPSAERWTFRKAPR